jgi:hypothetical protein
MSAKAKKLMKKGKTPEEITNAATTAPKTTPVNKEKGEVGDMMNQF